jgi:hypothetical protein
MRLRRHHEEGLFAARFSLPWFLKIPGAGARSPEFSWGLTHARRVIHHASSVRPPKSLVVRAGFARTFGSRAGFLVVTFLCGGLDILEDALANPLEAGAIKPRKRSGLAGYERTLDSAATAMRSPVDPADRAMRCLNIPALNGEVYGTTDNLAYQRFYVDHSRIRP